MNEREILKKAINRLQENITQSVCRVSGAIIFALILLALGERLLVGKVVLSIIAGIIIGTIICLAIWNALKVVDRECTKLWNKTQVAFSRQETTLEEILFALEEGKAAEEIAMYVGKRKKLEVDDDLALEKLEEREAEHIPRLE